MRNALLTFVGIHVSAIALVFASSNRVRTFFVSKDDLVSINCAVGIATIIQVPDGVQNVITGDSGAFKIEYLDKAITIKPLRYSSKTNLYINTKDHRYNLRLMTVAQPQADYVVYIKDFVEKKINQVKWLDYQRTSSDKNLSLSIDHIGKTKAGFIILSFSIRAQQPLDIKSTSIWLSQNDEKRIFESMYLSNLSVKKDSPIVGYASINAEDLSKDVPASLEISSSEKIKLEITRGALWRK